MSFWCSLLTTSLPHTHSSIGIQKKKSDYIRPTDLIWETVADLMLQLPVLRTRFTSTDSMYFYMRWLYLLSFKVHGTLGPKQVKKRNIILFRNVYIRGFNQAVNGFADDGWATTVSDGSDDVSVVLNEAATTKCISGQDASNNLLSNFGGGILCAKASMLLQVSTFNGTQFQFWLVLRCKRILELSFNSMGLFVRGLSHCFSIGCFAYDQ